MGFDPLRRIEYGQHVIIKLPSEKLKIVKLGKGNSISLGKFGSFRVDDVVGYPLGTKFEVYYDDDDDDGDAEDENKNETESKIDDGMKRNLLKKDKKNENGLDKAGNIGKVRVVNFVSSNESGSSDLALTNVGSSTTNKELINMGNSVQKLSSEEIEYLKSQSMSGSEIISRMIESHGNFDKKTIHSQEKYLKRKKQKFEKQFTINYLGSSALLQYMIDKNDIQRIMDMSEESIGMLLNLGNIMRNGTYLCMDETGGLLVYFLLERMFGGNSASGELKTGANGKVVLVHENEHPNIDLLKFSNYSEEFIREHVLTISLLDFFEPPSREQIASNEFKVLSKEEVFSLRTNQRNSYYRKLKWYKQQLQNIELACETQYDGLVVATTLHLPTLIPKLGERVHGSRPIVCYSQFKETLLELGHVLYDDYRYLAPTIYETRCRPYQTIRGKLHPLMTMRGGGGYLLWCHRVIPSQVPIPVPEASQPEGDSSEATESEILKSTADQTPEN